MRKPLIILGVPIDNLDMNETLDCIDSFVAKGRANGTSHQIATINADFVVNALHDTELRRILQEVNLATPDGTPLVWGARMLGMPLGGRVTGADMVPALAERAAQRGYSLYLLGAQPGVAAHAADILQQWHPGLRIAGVASPTLSPDLDIDQATLDDIRAAKPDVLLVAFGNPKQEKWISKYAHELSVPVCIGIGGTLDLIAGKTRRAPEWMQHAGLEWSFRLLQEPCRLWRRYVADLFFFGFFFLQQWWAMRNTQLSAVTTPIDLHIGDQTAIMSIHGRVDVQNRGEFAQRAEQALAVKRSIVIDMSDAAFLDSAAIGSLVAIANQAHELGGDLALAAVPPAIMQTLVLLRLDRFFAHYADVRSALAARPAHGYGAEGRVFGQGFSEYQTMPNLELVSQ